MKNATTTKDAIEIYNLVRKDSNGRDLYQLGPFLAYHIKGNGKFTLSAESLFDLWDVGERLSEAYKRNKQRLDIKFIGEDPGFSEEELRLAKGVYELFGGENLSKLPEAEDKGDSGILSIDESYILKIKKEHLDKLSKIKSSVSRINNDFYMVSREGIILTRRKLHGLAKIVLDLDLCIKQSVGESYVPKTEIKDHNHKEARGGS